MSSCCPHGSKDMPSRLHATLQVVALWPLLWLLLAGDWSTLHGADARSSDQGRTPHSAPLARGMRLDRFPLARCLDGSAPMYYVAPGAERAKFILFHEGGGFCGSMEDCQQRALGRLGSTTADGDSRVLAEPYFSADPIHNPLLHNWTKVFIRYCDGGYYSGDRTATLPGPNGKPMFFRGRYITEALVSDLSTRHGLGNATDVVVSGCSAGAIRVFAHLDAVVAMLPPTAKAVGFPDSGFYMDLDIFTPLKHFVVARTGQNATALLSGACKRLYVEQEEKCLVGSVVASLIQTPVFAWQSEYDHDQRGCEMTTACAASTSCINAYGANLTSAMLSQLISSSSHHSGVNGAFLDSCTRHCTGAGPTWPSGTVGLQIDGENPLQALASWYLGGRRRLWQQGREFPCASCCGK